MSFRPRFSLFALLVFAAVASLGLRGLTRPTVLWASLIVTLTIGACSLATFLALFRRHRAKDFWCGFALAGWGYLALALHPSLVHLSSSLLTTRLLVHAERSMNPSSSGFPLQGETYERVMSSDISMQGGYVDETTGEIYAGGSVRLFLRIGHALWALLFAVLGGVLAHYLRGLDHDTKDERKSQVT
jgi:hypothetical protein